MLIRESSSAFPSPGSARKDLAPRHTPTPRLGANVTDSPGVGKQNRAKIWPTIRTPKPVVKVCSFGLLRSDCADETEATRSVRSQRSLAHPSSGLMWSIWAVAGGGSPIMIEKSSLFAFCRSVRPVLDRWNEARFVAVTETLRGTPPTESVEGWVGDQLRSLAEADVLRGYVPVDRGGLGWSETEILARYLQLAAADLTTTFVLTQVAGALKRIASAENAAVADRLLPDLLAGRRFATLGISHLTTSRQHLGKPAVVAERDGEDFVLTGTSPWVTGVTRADVIVTGAVTDDGEQVLLAVETDCPGVTPGRPISLLALSASQTGPVTFERVRIGRESLIAGPVVDLMGTATPPVTPDNAASSSKTATSAASGSGAGAGTGGLSTSALAIGLAKAAVDFLGHEAVRRTIWSRSTRRF